MDTLELERSYDEDVENHATVSIRKTESSSGSYRVRKGNI